MEYNVNEQSKTVKNKDNTIALPKKEFEMLAYFQKNKGKIISREEILKNVWGYDDVVISTRTIDVHIRRLRRRFPGIPIVTRKCYGYIWEDE
jgi:two-component system alkaline phosphatase synthesis response regulator PhoP